MRVTELMKSDVGLLHFSGDPSPVLISARNRSARDDDRSERSIEGNLKTAFSERLMQPARYVKVAGFENQTWIGRPPENRKPLSIPGKNPQLIGKKQALDREIATDRKQAVGLRMIGRRK